MPDIQPHVPIEYRDSAEAAGLTYASTDTPGLTRRRNGRGFSYRSARGALISDKLILARIRALAIPPAWSDVWICPDPNGHIQAVGYDEKRRKQYRYHTAFRQVREDGKFEHIVAFAETLPALRRRIARDMATPGLGRDKVLATVVHLLETTMIRVGNETYAKENRSYGLTTLLSRHVEVDGGQLTFHFKGKSGKIWRLSLSDRRVARAVKTCQDLPGQHLFQYLDGAGEAQAVSSADVNAYLKLASGSDITAKDYRTWTGTVLAAVALSEFEAADSQASAKKNVTRAIERVASRLGNTPSICRKCYVHPEIVSAYLDGALLLNIPKGRDRQRAEELETLGPEEAAVLAFLRTRGAKDRSSVAVDEARRGRLAAGMSASRVRA